MLLYLTFPLILFAESLLGEECEVSAQCQYSSPDTVCTQHICTCQVTHTLVEGACVEGNTYIIITHTALHSYTAVVGGGLTPGLLLLAAPTILGCVLFYAARLVWLARLDHHR